jgi:hypothetical protein
MWLRRIVTFAGIILALIGVVWAELKDHPDITAGHQEQQYSTDQISGPSQPSVFSTKIIGDWFNRAFDWTEHHHDFVIAVGTVFLALFTLALFAATWGLVRFAKVQSRDMRQSIAVSMQTANAAAEHASHAERAIRVNQQSVQRQLRAYVTLAGIERIPLVEQGTGKVAAWRYASIWQNTGFTPTRRARNHVNWDFFSRGDSPEDRGFADLGPTSGLDDNSQLVIGPRTTVTGQAHVIGIDWIFASNSLQGRIFIWGWYEYDDVFADETPRRRTEFCSYLSWPGLPDMPNPAHASTSIFSAFNGTDEDCYRQPAPRQTKPT